MTTAAFLSEYGGLVPLDFLHSIPEILYELVCWYPITSGRTMQEKFLGRGLTKRKAPCYIDFTNRIRCIVFRRLAKGRERNEEIR